MPTLGDAKLYEVSLLRDPTPDGYYVLLDENHTPNPATHTQYSDLTNQISGGDYAILDSPAAVFIDAVAGEQAVDITTEADWGDPVTIPPCKWLVRVFGDHAAPVATDRLHFYMDLDTDGPTNTVSSTSARFRVSFNALGVYKATQP